MADTPRAFLFTCVFRSTLLEEASSLSGISGSGPYDLGDFRWITHLCGPQCSLLEQGAEKEGSSSVEVIRVWVRSGRAVKESRPCPGPQVVGGKRASGTGLR